MKKYFFFILFFGLILLSSFTSAQIIKTLNVTFLDAYMSSANPCSLDGATQMARKLDNGYAYVSSVVDDTLTVLDISNPSYISCIGNRTSAAGVGSLDGAAGIKMDWVRNIVYVTATVDDTFSMYNVTNRKVPVLLTGAPNPSSTPPNTSDGALDIAPMKIGDQYFVAVAASTDDYVTVWNVTNPSIAPTMLYGYTTGTSAVCSSDDVRSMEYDEGKNMLIIASYADDTVSTLQLFPNGTLTCLDYYTDSAGAGSLDGVTGFEYDNDTGLIYVAASIDDYFTILNASNASNVVVVGNGLTNATGYNVIDDCTIGDVKGSQSFAFCAVKDTVAGADNGIVIFNVTNPASPAFIMKLTEANITDGSGCNLNTTDYVEEYNGILYAISSADDCFYAFKVYDYYDDTPAIISSGYENGQTFADGNNVIVNFTVSGLYAPITVFNYSFNDYSFNFFNNLTLWYGFNNVNGMDTADAVNDFTGNYPGKILNSAQYTGQTDGFYRSAINISSATQKINTSTNDMMDTSVFSVAVWNYKPSGAYEDANTGYFLVDADATTNLFCRYYNPSGTRYITCTIGTTSMGNLGDSTANSLDTWHLSVITYNGTHARLYQDGVLLGTTALSFTGLSSYLIIGNNLASTRYFSGLIDDVMIWENRVLGQDEITILYDKKFKFDKLSDTSFFMSVNESVLGAGTYNYLLNVTGHGINSNLSRSLIVNGTGGESSSAELILEYSFESGAADSSCNGLNGTVVGSLTGSSGVVGNAYSGWSDNDYIMKAFDQKLNFTSAMSVCYWINITTLPPSWMTVVSRYSTTDNQRGWMSQMLNQSGQVARLDYTYGYENGSGYDSTSGLDYSANITGWNFICNVWDASVNSGRPSIYLNGAVLGSYSQNDIKTSNFNPNLTVPLIVGRSNYSLNRYVVGQLDELTIWNGSLNSTQVQSLHDNYVIDVRPGLCNVSAPPAPVNITGLHAEYSFESTATDTCNGINGTVVGSLTTSTGVLGNSYSGWSDSNYITQSPSGSQFNFVDAITICYWINNTADNTWQTLISRYSTTDNQRGWMVQELTAGTDEDTYDFTLGYENGSVLAGTDAVNYTANAGSDWQFVCNSWNKSVNAGNPMIFVDGVEVTYTRQNAKLDNIVPSLSVPFVIGRSNYTTSRYARGLLDEITIWGRNLDATEMSDLHQNYLLGYRASDISNCGNVSGEPPVSWNYTFDSASLTSYTSTGSNKWDLEFKLDQAGCDGSVVTGYDQCTAWTYFQMKGVTSGTAVSLRFTNFYYASGGYWTGADARPFVSCNISDASNWTKMTSGTRTQSNIDADYAYLTLNFTTPCDDPYVASFVPYETWRNTALFNEFNTSGNADIFVGRILNYTPEGRPVYEMVITNNSVSNVSKKYIIVVGGQHSAETYGDWQVDGMVRFLMNRSDENATLLRDNYVFYFYGVLNVDGRYNGLARYDPLGVDLNRAWDDTNSFVVNFTRARFLQINQSHNITMIIDLHGNGGTSSLHYLYGFDSSNTQNNYYARQTVFTNNLSYYTEIDNLNLASGVVAGTLGRYWVQTAFNWTTLGWTGEYSQYPNNNATHLSEQGKLVAIALLGTYGTIPAPVDISFSVSLPSSGCSQGNGCTTPACTMCSYCSFVFGLPTSGYINCTGQTTASSFYLITNTGNVAINVSLAFNQSINSALNLSYSSSSSVVPSQIITTTPVNIISALAIGTGANRWIFGSVVNGLYGNYTYSLNATSTQS